MGHQLLRELLANIRNSGFYSIMADETKDISNTEQLVICIRWVYSSYCIHEDPIGLVSTSATDAESIANAIKDVLVRCMHTIFSRTVSRPGVRRCSKYEVSTVSPNVQEEAAAFSTEEDDSVEQHM